MLWAAFNLSPRQCGDQSEKYNIPKIAFINKMDRIGADFFTVLKEIEQTLDANALPITIPIGAEDHFAGIIDLVEKKAVYYDDANLNLTYHETAIPDSLQELATQYRKNLIEKISEQDEKLFEMYIEGKGPSIY